MYDQNNILLLADAFEKLRNMCLETYEYESAHFFSA